MKDARGKAEERRDLFGGRGLVRVWNLAPQRAVAPFGAVLACELSPGGSVGSHRQEHDAEIVVCVSGEGRATVDGTAHVLVAHAVVALPLGSVLALDNLSPSEPLAYLIIKAQPPR